MIHVFLGTKAQLIKMAPVMHEMQTRGIDYNFIFSGQHQATVDNIREEFGIKAPDITLYEGRDITGIAQMAVWCLRLLLFSLRQRRRVWRGDRNGVVLVHGDTFSTLLGALLARAAGHRCAHVESGLRSFKLLQPFPEELTRLATFRLSQIYFAPGAWAVANLSRYRGEKVDTQYNTLLDALRISERAIDAATVDIPQNDFGVVSIHRFENIFSEKRLTQLVELLIDASQHLPLLFILHKPTEQKLRDFGLMQRLDACATIDLRPRYSYFQFTRLVKASLAVLTDGGSNQEECFYMGKPCIILRSTSERKEGLGLNAVISNYRSEIVTQVLLNTQDYENSPPAETTSPSAIIVDYLQSKVAAPSHVAHH